MTRPRLPATRSVRPRRRIRRALCVLTTCSLVSTGCAGIMNGRTQRVGVSSNPPGAQVFLGGEPAGVTPVMVDLPRRERDLVLRLEKDGFVTREVPVERSFSRWLWGDAVWSAVIGSAAGLEGGYPDLALAGALMLGITAGVDLATGAARTFPNVVRTTLAQASAAGGALRGGRPRGGDRLLPMRLIEKAYRLTGSDTWWGLPARQAHRVDPAVARRTE